jgi:uncharacterized membrane protein YcaP (DUF421 family)
MDYGMLIVRTLFIYFFIMLIMRIMGKREIGKLSIFDLVVSIMIAELAVVSLENPNVPMIHSLTPIIILFLTQIGLSYVSLKSQKVRDMVEGKPSFLIKDGKINLKEMQKQRYNLDDLLSQLRDRQINSPSQVEFAILETTGKLSVFPKEPGDTQKHMPDVSQLQENNAGQDNAGQDNTGQDNIHQDNQEGLGLSISTSIPEHSLKTPVVLIKDGEVVKEGLEQLHKNMFWLKAELRKRTGSSKIKSILFCSVEEDGQWYIDLKDTE